MRKKSKHPFDSTSSCTTMCLRFIVTFVVYFLTSSITFYFTKNDFSPKIQTALFRVQF